MEIPQMPAALTTPEAFISHWQKAETNERAKLPARRSLPAKQPWPKSLTDHICATEQALNAAKTPDTATDLTESFSRAIPHDIQEILESLVTLGRARMEGERFSM